MYTAISFLAFIYPGKAEWRCSTRLDSIYNIAILSASTQSFSIVLPSRLLRQPCFTDTAFRCITFAAEVVIYVFRKQQIELIQMCIKRRQSPQ